MRMLCSPRVELLCFLLLRAVVHNLFEHELFSLNVAKQLQFLLKSLKRLCAPSSRVPTSARVLCRPNGSCGICTALFVNATDVLRQDLTNELLARLLHIADLAVTLLFARHVLSASLPLRKIASYLPLKLGDLHGHLAVRL